MRLTPVLGMACAVLLAGAGNAIVLDALLARIDDDVVTWSELLQEVKIRQVVDGTEPFAGPKAVRDHLVKRRLLLAEATKLRLDVRPEEVLFAVERPEVPPNDFLQKASSLGMTEAQLEKWARQVTLIRKYLKLRREMTFIPEAEIRAFWAEQSDALQNRPLAEVREEVRAYLTQRKFQKELAQWFDRQNAEGRIYLNQMPNDDWEQIRIR